ncbi:MAG TPA: phosphopantetheine-binding protein [Polyangiaceae bacterium]|jgi:acyl carrier protein|nr:phosphopantetheine-binding protein [Polyangiaceae bacterium]
MVDSKSVEFLDKPALSSTRPHDKGVIYTICGILKTRFDVPTREVHLDSRFVEDLGLDALDLPDLILALEENFEMDISVAVAARILTVKDAVKCVLLK